MGMFCKGHFTLAYFGVKSPQWSKQDFIKNSQLVSSTEALDIQRPDEEMHPLVLPNSYLENRSKHQMAGIWSVQDAGCEVPSSYKWS